MRQRFIFILTHGYVLFIVIHLYFGDWCRRCQILFNVIPIIVFGGLILVWLRTSKIELNYIEKKFLKYFIWNLVFIYLYYCICIFSVPKWIYDKNYQISLFLLLTLTFYCLNSESE